jgi:Zn-dependent M28 family amino/carboxypeptidase
MFVWTRPVAALQEPLAGWQQAAERWITADTLKADIRFLAHDLLEGRGPGTRGDLLAQQYIATQFELLGLQPAAPGGGWVQPVPMVGVTTRPPEFTEFRAGDRSLQLKHHDDTVLTCGQPIDEGGVKNAELVFAGYGIQAPEFDWDDFRDTDVRGKVLVIMNNDPADDPALFAGSTRLYYGRWDYKFAKGAELGAAGMLIIHTTPSAGYPFQVIQSSWTGEQMQLRGRGGSHMPMEGWLSEAAARRLVALAGKDIDTLRASAETRDFRPVPLGITMSVTLPVLAEERETGNVLGLLPGSDPELAKEWVIVCAHHDHLGMEPKRDESHDNIFNGAVDNASGSGVLLGIARAITSLPAAQRPKRSILFAAVGAEEQGLLGSEYLALNPPTPAGCLAGIVNIDGINILGPTEDVVVIGKGKSDLDAIVQRIAAWQKRTVVPDQFPDHGYYYRSDQFSLAKVGVPGVYLHSGVHVIGKPDGWGREKLREWTDTIYHQTSDEFDENWDLSGAVLDAHLLCHVTLEIANRPEFPAWVPGDEFEAARKAALSSR